MRAIRWKVACINWSHPDAPHAMSYALVDGEMRAQRYHATWAEAMARVARADVRGVGRAREGATS